MTNVLKAELDKIQADHPDWTFRQCWQSLKRTRPGLISSSDLRPTREPDSEPKSHASTAQLLRQKVEVIRAADGLSFSDAWSELRRREPQLFTHVPAAPPVVVQAEEADYVMLRAADVDQLLSAYPW